MARYEEGEVAELINSYRQPSTYKAPTDFNKIEQNMKNAMSDKMFNVKQKVENPNAYRIA